MNRPNRVQEAGRSWAKVKGGWLIARQWFRPGEANPPAGLPAVKKSYPHSDLNDYLNSDKANPQPRGPTPLEPRLQPPPLLCMEAIADQLKCGT